MYCVVVLSVGHNIDAETRFCLLGHRCPKVRCWRTLLYGVCCTKHTKQVSSE